MGKRCGQSVCIRSLIFKKPAEYRDFGKAFVTFKILLVAQYKLKCNFIYVRKYRMAFAAPIFTNAQLLNNVVNIHVAYTEFHPNRSINAESLERKSSEPLIKVRLSLRQFS
jgi:hypothetical protein